MSFSKCFKELFFDFDFESEEEDEEDSSQSPSILNIGFRSIVADFLTLSLSLALALTGYKTSD